MFHYIFDIFQMAIIAIIGFHIENFVFVSVMWASVQILSHTTFLKKEIPILSLIFVTPSHHRVHHGDNQIYRNKNFAGIFSFWDKIFGSYQPELEREPVQFGVDEENYCANPIRANMLYWGHIFNQSKKEKKFSRKILIFFAMPESIKEKELSLSRSTLTSRNTIAIGIVL